VSLFFSESFVNFLSCANICSLLNLWEEYFWTNPLLNTDKIIYLLNLSHNIQYISKIPKYVEMIWPKFSVWQSIQWVPFQIKKTRLPIFLIHYSNVSSWLVVLRQIPGDLRMGSTYSSSELAPLLTSSLVAVSSSIGSSLALIHLQG
jgi:hypothetical protein